MFEEFNLTAFYIISQIFAVLSIIFDLVAAQRRKKTDLLKMDTLAAFCSSLHYAFLGAWSGLASNFIEKMKNQPKLHSKVEYYSLKMAKL